MANVLVAESSLQDIADAIRTKTGTQNTYKPSQMADAIDSISGGGITPTGTKEITITENGSVTEDVTSYASVEVTVDVETGGGGGDIDALIDGSLTSITSNATSIRMNIFNGSTALVSASFPEATSIGTTAFQNCTGLTSISLPKVTSGGSQCLRGCTGLTSLTFPKMTDHGASMFYGCSNLEIIDFGAVGSLASGVFTNCSKLKTIILRKTSVVTLAAVAAFTGTPFSSGGTGGTVYVPSSLISSYQTASNWSTLYASGSGTVTFTAIEGSQYE